jgi:hypothetical protein
LVVQKTIKRISSPLNKRPVFTMQTNRGDHISVHFDLYNCGYQSGKQNFVDRNAADIATVPSGLTFFVNIIVISEALFHKFELYHSFSNDWLRVLNLWFVPHTVHEVGICNYCSQHLSLG